MQYVSLLVHTLGVRWLPSLQEYNTCQYTGSPDIHWSYHQSGICLAYLLRDNLQISNLNLIPNLIFNNQIICIFVNFSLTVCVDVDFLLHIIGFCCIYFNIKNTQENISRNKTKFKRSCTDTFQVMYV